MSATWRDVNSLTELCVCCTNGIARNSPAMGWFGRGAGADSGTASRAQCWGAGLGRAALRGGRVRLR
eukprot:2028464-Prymnesium_polylepis.2